MSEPMREAAKMAAIQFALYLIICINLRAVAQADYLVAIISDAGIAAMQFFVLRNIAKSDEPLHLFAGYVTGSVLGTAAGIYLSKSFLS